MTIIYGGSFNPPTLAHYEIANLILKKFPEGKLVFVPTNDFYGKTALINFKYRKEMLEIMCMKIGDRCSVSNYEETRHEYCGTYYTLKNFDDPYFVLGADNLDYIEKWIKFPEVVIENKFIVIPRKGYDSEKIIERNEILKENKENFFILTEYVSNDISATKYRNTKNEKYILKEILDYIKENNLYN